MNRIGQNCRTTGIEPTENLNQGKSKIQKKSNLDISGCRMVVMMVVVVTN